jgi:PncC family amidohydrolase
MINEVFMREVHAVARLLKARNWTVAVAESCTGGLLGHLITDVPGSSAYFLGGVIAYADAVKAGVLDVDALLLQRWGAVSPQVAAAMAAGVRSRVGADVGIGITGIAGPTGGTAEKPVGLVYIGLALSGERRVWRHVWPGDRTENKAASAQAALRHLRISLS